MPKTCYLLLIICILISQDLSCQNLAFEILGHDEKENLVIDSIGYKKNHVDYSSILAELETFQKALFNIGYIENQVEEIKRLNDSSFASHIYLKDKIDTIYIYYDKNYLNKSILESLSTNITDHYFIVPISETEKTLIYINSKIASQGSPFTTLRLSNIKLKDVSNLQAELVIDTKNDRRKIDNIIIKGYENFPKSYLTHFLKLKPNQSFDLDKINLKMEEMDNLNFANQIKPPEALFTPDSTNLYLYIEKTRSNSFDGFIGFNTNEETGKFEFNGYLNLNLINNLNYGETLSIQYKSVSDQQKSFETRVALPYLFGSPVGAEVALSIFKQDTTFTNINQNARVYYQLSSKSKLFTGITSTQSTNLLNSSLSIAISDYTSTRYSIAYSYKSSQRNNKLFPFKHSFYVESGIGNRKINDATEKQSIIILDAFKVFNLNSSNSIYTKVSGASLFSDSYVENELFRFGGINSIRGFEENSLTANFYGVFNAEYRLQLGSNLYIHSITDFGYIENAIISQKEKLYGFGFGFGLLTKAGLLKFSYANGKGESQKFNLSSSKVHISLIAFF